MFNDNIHIIKCDDKNLCLDAISLSIFELDNKAVNYLNGCKLEEKDKLDVEEEIKSYLEKGYFCDLELPKNKEAYLSNYYISVQNTLNCPLNCKYCFAKKIKSDTRNMSIEKACDVVKFIFKNFNAKADSFEIYFTSGGEPLANFPVIKEISELSKELSEKYKKKIRLGITTNTLLLNDEIIKYMEESGMGLVISIDGEKEEHDANRKDYNGVGSHEAIMKALMKLRNSSSEILSNPIAIAVITPGQNDYVKLLKYLVDLGFRRIYMKLVRNTEEGNHIISEEQLIKVKQNYAELIKFLTDEVIQNRWKYVMPVLDPSNTLGQFIINLILQKRTMYRCDAGKSKFSILPNGEIYPCDYFSMLKETKLGDIDNGIDMIKVQQWMEKTCLTLEYCEKCWAKYLCGGGCYFTRYINSGKPDEIECEINRFLIDEIIKMLYTIQKNNNNIFKHLKIYSRLMKESASYVEQ